MKVEKLYHTSRKIGSLQVNSKQFTALKKELCEAEDGAEYCCSSLSRHLYLLFRLNMFSIMDGCTREVKAKVGNVCARLMDYGTGWSQEVYLWMTVLPEESVGELQRAPTEFYTLKRKLKVNVMKSKVTVFEKETKVCDF